MANAPDNALVGELARILVADLAPEELALFRDYSEQFFEKPEVLLRQRKSNDEMLGFGATEAVTMVTPFALFAAKEVLDIVWSILKKPIEDQGSSVVSAWLRGLFGANRTSATGGALTPEQLARVQQAVLDVAKTTCYPTDQAHVFSERIIARLALGGAA